MSGTIGDARKRHQPTPTTLPGYFIAPDAFDDTWLWATREPNYPVPVLAQRALAEHPDVWAVLVAAVGGGS